NGDPAVFSGVAGRLAVDFTVVTYARRGVARSPVDGPVDDANRIPADVEDAVALIARRGGGPAGAVGGSPGAVVRLHLVTPPPPARGPRPCAATRRSSNCSTTLTPGLPGSPGSSRTIRRLGCGQRWRSSGRPWGSQGGRPLRRPAPAWPLRSRRCSLAPRTT